MKPECQIHNTDCITGMAEKLGPATVDLCITSIPFEDLFQYSNRVEDMGNNGNTIDIREGRFALNLRFFIDQLFRVIKPGCNACIHIQQLLAFKNQHGFMGRRDFRGAVVDLFRAGGFDFAGEFTVAKDPQVMANQLNLHSLQFKTGHSRSGTWLMPCPNDYVLIFQKPGATANPVRCLKHDVNPGGWVAQDEWIRDACGTWSDIMMTDVLDVQHSRESKHEKHVCPLQLSLIRRLVRLYTNPVEVQPDVLVLDPFMGIGSTAHVCLGGDTRDGRIEAPRNVVGFELKESYHRAAIDNAGKALAALTSEPTGSRQTSFLTDPEEQADELPAFTAGDKVFACNRCNQARLRIAGHPCKECGCPEYRLEVIDASGRPTKDLEARAELRAPAPKPKAKNNPTLVAPGIPRDEFPTKVIEAEPEPEVVKPADPGGLTEGCRIIYRDRDGRDWRGIYRFTLGDLASVTLDKDQPGSPASLCFRIDPSTLRRDPDDGWRIDPDPIELEAFGLVIPAPMASRKRKAVAGA